MKILKTFVLAACAATIAPAATQTIAFDPIPDQILGVSPFVIAAQASSLLPVSFVSATPTVCKNSGALVMVLNIGTCSITASQAGNLNFNAATAVTQSFNVRMAGISGSFKAATGSPFSAGTAPRSLATADFNGDGLLDIAVADQQGGVTVLLGNGSGGFTVDPGGPFSTGTQPSCVVAGDFNADGKADLAVANYTSGDVTVLLGNGEGAFTQATGSPFAIGTSPFSLVIADVNADGIQDLVTSNSSDNSLTLLIGNGAGGFTPSSGGRLTVGTNPTYVAVGDFNGDGFDDLAVANPGSSNITVLLGNGSGGFTQPAGSPFTPTNRPFALAAGDFNGDGIQDLATGGNGVSVLQGNGLGGFTDVYDYPSAIGDWESIVVADFNGDGKQDFAAARLSANEMTLFFGDGTGGFSLATTSPYPTGDSPVVVLDADFNGDGIMDLAAANGQDGNLTVLLGLVVGSKPQTITFGALSNQIYPGSGPVSLSATSDSGLTVSFASATPAVCEVTGTTVTIVGNFTCTIVASQIGNGTYAAAATVTQSFSALLAQTILFSALPNVPVSTAPFALSATVTVGYSGNVVSFTSNTLTVCSVSGNIVTILASGGCSITASQPGNSYVAAASPVTQSFTVLFGDVSPDDIFYAEVNAFAQYGITNGCAVDQFCPTESVTRDEMAVFIVRAIYGSDNFTYTTTPYFTDVTPSTFGFQWIQKLRDLGITSGCTATTYCPGEVVTRDQMAIFVIRARLGVSIAGATPTFTYPSTAYFTDATAANEFAYPWIQRMRLENITNGCTATTYCPLQPVTREEMATLIMRGAFNQFLPAGTPVISQISPAVLAVGTSGAFTVTGLNTNFVQGTTVLSPIPGVTIGAVTVSSPTSLTVQLTAAADAVAQPYSVLAITGSEQDVLPNGLVLQ